MKEFESKSSNEVKLITTGIIVAMLLLIISFILNNSFRTITGIGITAIIITSLFYFYSVSLKKIILSNDKLIIKRNIGSVKIPLNKIQKVEKLSFSNLSMTVGSKGFFGYSGNTMDNSLALVNDRTKMLRIFTPEKSYTISCERAYELIDEIIKSNN